jgi:outer membrane protein
MRRRSFALLAFAALAALPALPALAGSPPAEADADGFLSLPDAIAATRAQSRLIAEAKARAAMTGAQADEGRAALLPHLGAEAGYRNFTFNRETVGLDFPGLAGMDRVLGPVEDYAARLSAHMDVVNVSAWKKWRAALARTDAASQDTRAVADEAEYLTALAYIRLAKARQEAGVGRENLKTAESFLARVRDQKSAGTATGIDATRAQLQVHAAQSALLAAGSEAEAAKFALLSLLGRDQGMDLAVDTLELTGVALPLREDSLVGMALARRAELKSEERTRRAAELLAGAARSELLPVLRVGADIGYDGAEPDRMEAVRTVGVTLNWSGWDGGAGHSRTLEQRALAQAAEARLRDARARIEAETRTALSAFKVSLERVRTAEDFLALSLTELGQAEDRFKSGLAGSLDVIEAQNGLTRARTGRIEALYFYNATRMALLKAVGRLGAETSGQPG